eukprot:gnl/TRDRNA2_/TRDRNA2_122231_c2_seq1.p1 gnl/TRDRNA2_/TRDRNA2_122231_c2~~gnl/TRDRNA2_/TRDRNA2_122231_c2_seq1.p1  ORF type:complete len:408 (-),score=68.37 gnl/TRDRNA2_/TRDRNA2_122231_c2_seq1:454-1677(-)
MGAVGVHLGLTYSTVGAIMSNDQGVKIAKNKDGLLLSTPCCLAFTETGRLLVGAAAKEQIDRNPYNTIFNVKRLIGRKFSDTQLQRALETCPFKCKGEDDEPKILVKCKESDLKFQPKELSAIILAKMKQVAEDHIDSEVKDVVITVPACFNKAQKDATREAATLCGLNVLDLIDTSTAAAMAFCFQERRAGKDLVDFDGNFLVCYLGGGTLDVSLLSVKNGIFEVKGTTGDLDLVGGENFDQSLVNWCTDELESKHKTRKTCNDVDRQRLKTQCEVTKMWLSQRESYTLKVGKLRGVQDFTYTIRRETFEQINESKFCFISERVEDCLKKASVEKCDVDTVLLAGGSADIPKLSDAIRKLFGDNKPQWCTFKGPRLAAAVGATVQAAIKKKWGSRVPALEGMELKN